MTAAHAQPGHIEITETLLRLYVFLSQHLDRCRDEASRRAFPEEELQAHLAATRSKLMELLAVNRVVKGKVEQECERVLALGAACMKSGGKDAAALEQLQRERAVMQNKTVALSDLLAVFRAV
jgi:hypothetical protein